MNLTNENGIDMKYGNEEYESPWSGDGCVLIDPDGKEKIGGYYNSMETIESGYELKVTNGDVAVKVVAGAKLTLQTSLGKSHGCFIEGGSIYVNAGATASSDILFLGGKGYVYKDGTAMGTTIESDSYLYVSGKSDVSWVHGNGTLVVMAGGISIQAFIYETESYMLVGDEKGNSSTPAAIASETKIGSGIQKIYFGGEAITTYLFGGVQQIHDGGKATKTFIGLGEPDLWQMQQPGGEPWNDEPNPIQKDISPLALEKIAAEQQVFKGGKALNATIYDGATQTIYNGGEALDTIVCVKHAELAQDPPFPWDPDNPDPFNPFAGVDPNNPVMGAQDAAAATSTISAIQFISQGGKATRSIVSSGGSQYVLAGGEAVSATIHSGAVQQLSGKDAKAQGTVISGGKQIIQDGASDSGTTIHENSLQQISAGGTANGAILKGGEQLVEKGGIVSGAAVSGGVQNVLGEVNNAVVYAGGTQKVSATATVRETVLSGGIQSVSAGTAIGTKINANATQNVGIQAVAKAAANIAAIASMTEINTGGQQNIYSGGKENSGTLNGGTQNIFSGGIAESVTINAGVQNVLSGGEASKVTINKGGSQVVCSTGKVNTATINDGGLQQISSGGMANGTTIKMGGSQHVFAGGSSLNVSIMSGGMQTVLAGGYVSGGTVYLGGIHVAKTGAVVNGLVFETVSSSTTSSGGTTSSITSSGGINTPITSSGGSSSINSSSGTSKPVSSTGAGQFVSKGAVTNNLIFKAGTVQYINGGTANRTQVLKGAQQIISKGGRANSAILTAGIQKISAGGLAIATIAKAGAQIQTLNGGKASNAIVSAGGSQIVFKGGSAVKTTVRVKGKLILSTGAAASSLNLSAGAYLSAGTCTIGGNNTITGVKATGAGVITLVNGAALTLCDKAVLAAKQTLNVANARLVVKGVGNSVGALTTNKATNLTFDLAGQKAAGSTAMLKASALKTQTGKFTINTASLQELGNYELASRLNIAKNTAFTIKAGNAGTYTLKLNGAGLNKNGISYTLKSGGANKDIVLSMKAVAGKIFKGNNKNEKLNGTSACDIFFGAGGNDIITANGGRDVAVYDKANWGKDTINTAKTGTMTILFNGITAAQVTSKFKGKDLTITRKGAAGQQITIKNWNSVSHNIVFGGTLKNLSKYLSSARPSASLTASARNEVWKKTGLLA